MRAVAAGLTAGDVTAPSGLQLGLARVHAGSVSHASSSAARRNHCCHGEESLVLRFVVRQGLVPPDLRRDQADGGQHECFPFVIVGVTVEGQLDLPFEVAYPRWPFASTPQDQQTTQGTSVAATFG